MAKQSKQKNSPIKFRAGSGARVGFTAAEQDTEFLEECFVSIGQLDQLLDLDNPGSILLGRTGAGKSATLIEIANRADHVIRINPSDLALQYVSSSTILKYFEDELDVDLSNFYQFLWKHVLSVELLNYKYNVQNQNDFSKMLQSIRDLCSGDKSKEIAIKYLDEWGSQLWQETSVKVQEIVKQYEDKLIDSPMLSVNLAGTKLSIKSSDSQMTNEEIRTTLEKHGREVVNNIQIRQLAKLMDAMEENIFNGRYDKYYIIIDNLDEDWVSENLRLKLIRALLDTLKSFRRVHSVKIIVALRVDLIERIYKYTRSKGSQRGKDRDWEVELFWTRDQLLDLADRRISFLMKRQYTKDHVKFFDIFPENYRQAGNTFDHIVKRTLMRPRDIVVFLNEVLMFATGKAKVTPAMIDNAETSYSKERKQDIFDEWEFEHPYLADMFECFRGSPNQINYSDLTINVFGNLIYSKRLDENPNSEVSQLFADYFENNCTDQKLISVAVKLLYGIGFFSIRLTKNDQIHRIVDSSFAFEAEELNDDTRLYINPIFWGALNIQRQRVKGKMQH